MRDREYRGNVWKSRTGMDNLGFDTPNRKKGKRWIEQGKEQREVKKRSKDEQKGREERGGQKGESKGNKEAVERQ